MQPNCRYDGSAATVDPAPSSSGPLPERDGFAGAIAPPRVFYYDFTLEMDRAGGRGLLGTVRRRGNVESELSESLRAAKPKGSEMPCVARHNSLACSRGYRSAARVTTVAWAARCDAVGRVGAHVRARQCGNGRRCRQPIEPSATAHPNPHLGSPPNLYASAPGYLPQSATTWLDGSSSNSALPRPLPIHSLMMSPDRRLEPIRWNPCRVITWDGKG